MEPTLKDSERILVIRTLPQKTNFFIRQSKYITKKQMYRNSIIVSKHPYDQKARIIKRCVGVPGDLIEKDTNNMFRLNDSNLFHLNDNNFQINNKSPIRLPSKGDIVPIELLTDSFYYNIFNNYENFESDFLNSSAINDSTFVMPKFSHSYYFIMGDNYSNSKDSRHWGPIPDYLIVGKMISFYFVYKL